MLNHQILNNNIRCCVWLQQTWMHTLKMQSGLQKPVNHPEGSVIMSKWGSPFISLCQREQQTSPLSHKLTEADIIVFLCIRVWRAFIIFKVWRVSCRAMSWDVSGMTLTLCSQLAAVASFSAFILPCAESKSGRLSVAVASGYEQQWLVITRAWGAVMERSDAMFTLFTAPPRDGSRLNVSLWD